MVVDLRLLHRLMISRRHEIEGMIEGTGYLLRTVLGVGTFLLDNEGDVDLLTAKQRVIFEKFIQPLLESQPK